ncbi:dystonin isoform X7 [Gadus morhua]|uniref:dystonin isoform X7 n=1 Tax=Gadus morhua TaxID=8049 RepID=UPI0011B7C319|nr:dystonin isoform X7 [Gadus morhua]
MGNNACGCVRSPKEDYYVDPRKAPLVPSGQKEHQGRRYFQRKKRKSEVLQPGEEPPSPAAVDPTDGPELRPATDDRPAEGPLPGGVRTSAKEPVRDQLGGAGVGGVRVAEPRTESGSGATEGTQSYGGSASTDRVEVHGARTSVGETPGAAAHLHSEGGGDGGGRRGKSVCQPWHGPKRAASLGAAEQTLLGSPGGCGGSRVEESEENFSTETRQRNGRVLRGRGRASSRCGYGDRAQAFGQGMPANHEISEIHVAGQSEDMTAKERLLFWSKQMTDGYVGVRCDNFTTSWRDGRLFNAIIHKYRPDLVDMSLVSTQSNRSNLEQAFDAAEQLGVARLLDPEDVDVQSPDEKSVITYVSTLYDSFPKVPDGGDGINANDVDIKWVEYQNMIKYLSQWIKHNVTVMSDRAFPNNPVELKALYTQYLQFKEHEIPLKENEKTKINHLYEMLEVWIEFGRIQLPAGHHPNDIEKEWGKLIVAMLEREKSLRPEVERLEMLQQIANRVQRDCVNGEDKLSLARTALQSDAKRLEAGIQFQNEAEIAGYLLECENTLRQQVMDIQMLLDGKFPFADQLVQRVSKLRDDLLSLRTECSSVYNQGRTLTAEQTKRMISGISNSLNFAQNANPALSPALSPGGAAGAGSTFTSSGLGPALTPGLQPQSMGGDGGGGGMEPMSLQHLKHAQILKPLVKPSLLDTDMTEGEANMNFVQDLLNWVEEMQVQVDRGEWGTDLPSVETQIDDFKSVHQAIEEFQTSLKEAKHSEFQMTVPLKHRYSEKLSDLESNYEKLLNCSRKRQSNLEKLHDFVSRATQELIWLNEKEEEEVAFDWSDRNGNINNKRDYHADLMRELEEKEEAIKSVQDKAESLMLEQHPARPTIEAYRAAMQTQWNWILQLCSCVEQHLKENAVYFEFFGEAKESLDRLKNLQDAIHRKYSCDRTSSLHKLEDLVQESMEEKEQLLQYSTTVAGLVGRAKTIVQLRPRNPDSPVRSSIPVKAICDYRQIEITIFKDDECVLASNAHRAKWKVINPGGNEAMVPSVCFTVPPPNKEALEMASRIEQTYQNVLSLWHHSHVNMKSVVSWHYLMADIRAIRNWNVASVKTLLSGAHQQEVLSNLDSHFEEFLADSEESEVFTVADRAHSEREVEACKQYYEELLRSAEREEHEESQYNHYISEVRNFRMHLEAHEEHLIRKIRTPLDRDDLEQSQLRISEQEKKMSELDQLKGDLEVMKEKCEVFLKQASTFPSLPTLSSELLVLVQNMGQVYSMSSIFMDKLKTVSLVVENSQRADALVKVFESKLYEEDAVNCDLKSIETVISTLKHWRSEMDEQQEVFHDMEDELKKARSISERMFKVHNERDFDLDWHREKADQLSERWHSVHSQIDNRLRELESISKSLKYYKDSFSSLDEWVKDMEAAQLKAQENQPEDSKALAELLNTQKVLVAEIEQKQSRITECQKHSEQYSSAVKDYELQLMTYRAMVDSQHKSPLKKRRMQNSSDAIQQEFMDLRTRYTALVTLMTQCVKFASETLRRAEEEERSADEEKKEHGDKVSNLLHWMSDVKKGLSNGGKDMTDGNANTEASNKPKVSIEEMVTKKEQIAEALRATQMMLNKHSDKMSEEERQKAQEQLMALSQAYCDLSQQCADQMPSTDQDFEVETWDEFTAQNGRNDQGEIDFLLACPLNSGLYGSDLEVCPEINRALKQDARYNTPPHQSPDLNNEGKSTQSPPPPSTVPLTAQSTLREGGGKGSEQLLINRIGFQHVGDELNMCCTGGDAVTVERTYRSSLFPATVNTNILENPQLQRPEESSAGYGERGIEGSHSSFTPEHIKMLFADGNTSPELLIGQGVGQSQQTDVGLLDGGGMTADEAVQCDLMRHSTTLIVLDKQKGFTGLLIPSSDEITIVSSWSEHRQLDSDYSSTLLRDRPKIAAFYIPENDEVVDIDSATKLGFIDHHTAELLKSIEFPAALPDIEQLNAKFSSWLMLRELTLDGNRASGDLESSIGHPRTPSPSEMRQLLTSYLMMNSYLDTKSEQRLVVLDRRLTNMVQHLVEDLALSESQEPMCSSDDSDVYDISRQGGYEVDRENYTEPGASLHIDEEDTNDLSRNMLAFESHATVTLGSVGIFDQAQFSHAEGAEYNAYESTFCVSIESGSFDKDNDYTHSSAFDMRLDETQLTHMEVTEYNADDTVCVSTEYISYDEDRDYTHSTEFDMSLDETQLTHVEVAEYSADDNTVCISTQYISFEKSIDNTHSTEFEGVNTQYYLGTEQERNNYEGFDIPMLSETSNFPTSCSGNVLTSHSLSIKNNSESYSAALNSSDETQSDLNPNSLCIRSGHTNDVSTEPSCFQRVPENTLTVTHKNTYALEKAQIEQGDILSHTTSVDNYSPERPVFNELASGSLVLQLSGEEQRADEKGPLSVLKQSVPSGSESSYDALHINDPPSLLGSGCDINSNCLVTMGGNLAFKDVSERVTAVVPPSDPTPRAIINPEESVSDFTCIQRIPGLISGRDQESSLQHFTESKVAVMMLDVPDEQIDGMGLEGRSERAEWRSVGKAGEISHPPHPVLASFISHGPAGTQMSSSVSWNQVTEASSFPHNDGALSPRADLGRQEMIHSQLTHTINQYETASQNHAQPTQSPVPDQTDRAFDCSIESPLAHEYTTLANLCCEGDGSPVDRDFLTDKGCYGLPGNPTVSPVQSDSGMSSSHSDVLSEESKTENVSVSLAQSSLISEHSQARDDALPRDVFESAVSSCTASRGDDEREITGASHEITYPEQPFGSEGNCSVEMKPASAVLQAGIGDTGCIQAGADSNNRLESDFIAADVVEFGRDIGSTISLEEQHGQSLTMTNDGMPVCLSTDPDTIETRMIGLSDTTMKIDCCSNKTISADIHSDRLPNDKQTGSQTVISADGNRCSDYTFAQSPTSFSGGLSDSPIVIGDTGCIQAGADSNNWLESDFIAADVVEFGRDIGSTISLEEQHGQSLTMTNDGMPVCLSTDPDTIETHMIGLSDTTMKIDCCSNKTISADIHSDRLPNDKQTGSQMVISADGNRCGDYTFAQSPASFSGGLLDSPAFSDKAYLSDVVRRIHDKQEALGVEEVHLDPLPDSTQPVEGGTDDVTAEALLKTNTQIDGQCTQQANVDNVAVEGVNIDALQKPDTQHGGAEVEGVKVDVLQQTYTQQDERGAEQVRVNASEEPNIEHEGGGVNRLNIDRGVEGENADTLHEPNTNHEEKRAEQMHDDKGAMMNGVALQKVNTQHDEGDTERFNVEEGVMEEGGRDAQCIEDVNVDLLEKPDTEREAAGVKGFNVEILQETYTPHVEGGAEGVYEGALQEPKSQSGQGDTEQVNISEGAIDGVNIDVLPKPDRQHQEGGKEKADISIDVTGLDGKCIEEVTIHALLKASPQKGEVGIDGVNLDDSQETHTGHDDGLTEQFKVDAVQKPNACYEEGDVKGVNSDGKGIEGQELNVEVLGKNTTQHEERGLNAESIEEVHLDTLEGGVKVDRQESKTLQDEEGTVGINIDALQKSRTQLVEGGVKEGNSYEGGIETVNMDERAVEELIVEASLRPNTPIEERGSEMADTQRVNGGAEESVVDDLRDATTEEDRGSVTEDQDTMTRWSDMALTTEDEPLDSLQISGLEHLVKWRDQLDLSATAQDLGDLDSETEEELGEASDMTQPLDVGSLQSKLLQVLQNVPESQDQSVLKGVIESLVMGSDSEEERWHTLDSIKEESSEEEEEDGERMDTSEDPSLRLSTELCHPLPAQTSSEVPFDGEDKQNNLPCCTQEYLECLGGLQDHADFLDDVKNELLSQCSFSSNMEELQDQLGDVQTMMCNLAKLEVVLMADLEKAKELLGSVDGYIPTQIRQDLASSLKHLGTDFTAISQMCTIKSQALTQAIESGKLHLDGIYQKHLSKLDKLSGCLQDNSETWDAGLLNTYDVETLKQKLQQNKEMESNLQQGVRLVLEDVAFDVQSFVSENTEFLSSAQSKHILKLLSTTQRAFREQTETVAAQRQALEGLLDARERDTQQQVVTEKQKEFASKLDELCDSLTLTENRLMGHQHEAGHADSVSDLQQYQQEHQALQKDVLTNAGALNDVISSTKKFLEENRAKMSPEQVAAVEKKLEEAKSKAKLINQRAEESRKDLEKVVTTAIKQESEKTAAVEQLEESKNKIEGLLGWISNIGNEKEAGTGSPGDVSKENGNLPEETSAAGAPGEEEEKEDDANGNGPDTAETDSVSRTNEKNASLDIDKQYDRVKARHQEILSQQQELIMATQSAQALLDKQAQVLAPEEQEKLQRDVQELRARYDASLTQAEQQMKQVQSVQEELGKFQGDSVEFEAWLDQAEAEMEELCAPGDGLDVLAQKLQRQKSFSEDVISHKGDLRFITISGQKVLDVAKACSSADAMDKGSQLAVDTSGSCASVKKKLDSAAGRYKALYTQCNSLASNLKDVVDKYTKYEDSSAELVKWLNSSEEEARRQQSEAIAADPQTLQIQLEDTKSLQGQMTGRQTAVETLRKTSDSLISCEGDLLSHPEAIQEIVDDIAERYDNLSKSVSDRNEKLQITLTRSMSVQDGLDEMMGWMQGLEDSVREKGSVPLDSPALGSLLSKEAALGQDIASRQSSISAIKAKVEKFAETADASAAAPLQSKMESLSRRLADTCDSHNLKVSGLEEVKDKVERFEKTAEEVQQFVQKRSQELRETDGPGKSFKELSQLVKDTTAEMAEHSKDLDMLKSLSKELCPINPEASKAQIQGRLDSLASDYSTLKDIVKEKEEEVSSCQDQLAAFRTAAGALTSWLEETDRKVPTLQPGSGGTQSLEKDLLSLNGLLEEWTAKGPAVQELNSQGAALCTHISALTSPAKKNGANKSAVTNGGGPAGSHAYLTNKDLMVIQQNMSYVSEGYTTLEGRLRSSAAQLSELLEGVKETQKEADLMVAWLGDMKHKAASGNSEAGEKGSVKAQLEQQKEFEADMKQKQEKLQQLRQKLLHLLETHPDSPEAATWKQMLAEIDAAWDEVTSCAEERKQHLERSSRNLEAFHTAEPQLRQWLSEKELMMTVLGPLSVDLNMLKMQKQQVQILQNEFESRKPQYEELHKAAAAILDPTSSTSPTSPSSSSSEVQAVTEQLAGVTQKWEDVTGQLGSRAGLIDQAALKTGQLQELLKGLGAASGRLDAQLSGEQGQQHSTQPDAVKKQLEQVHSISAQLREERRRLKEAEAVATELTAMVTEDYLKADLARQLESVSKPFKQLEEKAAKRAQQLASTFDSSQQFHRASEEFQTWLDERLREEASPRPVSAQVEPLQRSLTEHEALRRALSDHERPYATIAGEGEALLQDTDGAEKLALQGQLATLSSNWEAVKKGSADRGEALATALQRAVRYRDQAEKLSAWAEECEASRDRVQTAVDPVALESSLSQLKALQKDVDKHRGAVEQLNAAADSLLEAANADTDGVKEERAALGERVDKLAEGLQSKRESLEKTSQTLKDFNDTRKEAKSQIERAQKQVEAYESLGAQAHSTKTLTNMKAQQKSLEAVQSQLEQLKNLAKDLVVDVPDADGVTDLLLQADGLEKDYGSLNKKVEETCSTLEGKLQGIGQFQNDIREMYGEFTDLDDELDGMEPVALDLAALKDQQEGIQGFTTKLREVTANTVNAGENCRKMLETESSPELFGLKRDVDALSKQCGKLLDRARGREEQVVEARRHLEELHSKLRRSGEKLSRAVATEEAQGVVAVETEVINQQLEAFKVFEKEEIEPLQTELQDINSLGQALIQGAAKASSTQGLEDELDSINAKWNTLNKKVAERSAQLHEALLHCGRFQDALESLLSWLTDTEELVANQKAPSAEFKVVKAQIQEQKLLQRLLDDRKPTVELIKKEGGKVAELAESVDRDKVAREMEGLGQRWDTLLKKAENRHKQLESILVVTQKFHETLEPLSDWLQATEKHLANSEPIGTESSKLEKQISQQKALEEEILSHSRDLCQALSLGQMLRGAVSAVDDVDLVQVRLDATQASYIELQERCRRRADTLRQALANARLFGEDEVALMNWLSEAHGRLSEAGVQDPRPDALEEQLAEQRALQEDIKLRRQNVDQAIANGMELLKQTTGDEVVAIQGKLDGIKTKYAEIDTMSRGVCDNLQRVLGLSTELQGTHQELDSWLGGVEAEVSSFAGLKPVGEELTQAQDRQKALLKEAKERKPLVDKLNELSGSLLDLVPWHAREGLDKLVTADNERYRALSDAVTQHVDRINADMLKSQQFGDAADAELAWLSEAQDRLQSMGEIRLEQDQTLAQLQAQKVFSMDIMRHKDSVDELVKTGKAIMDSKSPEEKEVLQAKSQALVERYAAVCQLNSERCLQLERAQSLAGQFWETYEELCPWLQDTLAAFSQLHLPAIEYETLRRQQEELRQMRELIAEHKPHIDKMNKTGPQLLELSPLEGEPIREKYTATDRLYAKLKADVTQRAATLDEAISKSTQFHDKIDPMLESLERMSERLRQPPSISVEVEKIREQLTENKAGSMDLEKLQPSYEMLRQRGEEMIARSEGADKDLSAKAVQDKLDQMVFLWQDIQALQEEREAKLLDVMDLADKFWCEHCALLITTKDSQDLLKELEEPGVDPSVVKQQLEFVEGFKEEIDGLQEELEVVQNLGTELMTACGEPDKPIMKKSLDEVNLAWENLDKTWKERVERLEEAMQAAVQFQDGLQGMFDWVDILESKLDSMPPVGTDVDTVKQQLADLKEYKGEAYQLQIELERLNHAAGLLLKKVTDEADRSAIQEPMAELKMLWDNLDEKIINRQHKLEGGLLALGQFQHALDELLAWMSHTDELLGEQRKAGGDPKAIEIELAKHHVLENDVLAHKTTVETVQRAGGELVQSSAGEEASALQTRLDHLNQRWTVILERTGLRRQQLESSLLQAQGFHGEIEDMQQWLKDTERQLLASKAVGGLPDTAREQLSVHLELCAALEAKEELYGTLVTKGQQLLTLSPEGLDSNTEQDLANLRDKWGAVRTKVAERKVKLEEALTVATDFHDSLQDFINWLTQAEQTLTMVSPASLIMDTVMFQIDEHKMFVTEVNGHRDHIIELDKTGTHLKYFSQKQDVVLIKNLLVSVQARWEKLLQRSVERGRMLDDARKRAKQFHETWTKLMDWLEESEKSLDSEVEIANDPDRIKAQLAQHKEFQKAVGSKHAVYDTTARTGRALKDKTGLKDDKQKLDDMLSELRDKWDTVCGKSVERQNKLEEALLISGQFTEALQALIDWLYKVEPQMAEDQPVHGDIDLVLNLIDNHKVFQKELGKRTVSVAALKRSARELLDSSHDDPTWVRAQMGELGGRWDTVCTLSVSKQSRLEQALGQAEEFHSTVHILLEWLAEAEQSLRFHGSLPDDEDALRALIEQHEGFMKKLEEKRAALNKATSLGEDILTICHPDSITTIKHWNTIIKARFEEVQAWARQHQQRLATALEEQQATAELLKGLLTWLQWAESSLDAKDKEALPQELEEVKGLIAQHQTFMEEMTRKQPDVDIITKTHKRKNAAEPAVQSQIPVLEKGRPGRKRSPTQALYQAASQTPLETKNPQVNLLVSKWQQVWLLALDRRRKLNDALDRLEELKEFDNFDFDVWRKKYMRWMNHKKSRVMDFFRRIDKDQDGKVTREEFIEGILSSRFPTSRLEMSAVADIFDRDGDGFIDYYEFVAALHPNKEAYKPLTDADKIEDEVTRQVAKCKCPKRFQVEQIGANKYRFYLGNQFGDSQQLRLVRILRSTVMVRVGGGWMALDEFLVKNDPCRVHHHGSKMLRSESNSSITQSPLAKGRTNLELREKFILPEGTTQIMASFRYRGRRSSRPSSRAASPNRSTSSHSCPAPAPNATPVTTVTSGTPKGTPVQGSKLRLPGYLSGKGFQSGEEGTLINNAVLKARAQAMGERKNPSQPGSRGSSRRGSDASDFDISDIQSVCSDASENVGEHGRPSPRGSAARQHGGKPSKIPTPKRRATPTSKLAKGSKR